MASPGMNAWLAAIGVVPDFILIDDYTLSTVAGSVTISFGTSGNLSLIAGTGGPANPRNWWFQQPVGGIGNSYEVRLTVNSGSNPSTGPSINTWHTISSTQTWTLSSGNAGNWTIEVREIADTSKIDSGVFIVTTI